MSELLWYHDNMPYPNMSLLEGFDRQVLDSYPGQIYLRNHLNSIHRTLYAPKRLNEQVDQLNQVDLLSNAISIFDWVAPGFAFSDADPPATDILNARIRAKYWGAQVITYRPFIKRILQPFEDMETKSSKQKVLVPSEKPQSFTPQIDMLNTHIDSHTIELAKKGIKALVESTRAFHGLGRKRPVITNTFGTAHA